MEQEKKTLGCEQQHNKITYDWNEGGKSFTQA